ncbi:hypothetical protein [Cryptosporangium phraense]|nr:hypothetical protein [Cryptosporangium phraense]
MLNLEFIEDILLDELPDVLAGELAELDAPVGDECKSIGFGNFV